MTTRKALAVSNNDLALAAWTFGEKIDGCLGFSIHRIDLNARTETPLPAWVGFAADSNPNWQPKNTDIWPIQKFNWKDLTAARGGLYQYKIIPMGGTPGSLKPLADIPALLTNPVQVSPNRGLIKSYFNRGILASQFVSRALSASSAAPLTTLKNRIDQPRDPLRNALAGDMCQALIALLDRAARRAASVFAHCTN